jgi:outer membrane protein assembly factor BamE
MPPTRAASLSSALLAAMLAGACARSPVAVTDFARPYRITIQQGNYVTREMVEQLRPGMTKEQVRFLLGTPLVTDIFHADRWDYVFYRDAPGGRREHRNFAVIFEDGRLARVIGDLLPADPSAAPAPAVRPVAAQPESNPEAAKSADGADRAAAAAPAPAAGNWRAASDPAAPPAAASDAAANPDSATAAERAAAGPEARAEDKPARGFFGRILERIGF